MVTAVYANYKPTDTLSASGIISDLPPDYGFVSNIFDNYNQLYYCTEIYQFKVLSTHLAC